MTTTPGPSETIHPTDKIAGRWVADMQPVRVLDGAGLGTTMDEGWVMGYIDGPSLLVLREDGEVNAWPVALPWQVTGDPTPPEQHAALLARSKRRAWSAGPSASGQPTPASDLSLVESVARFVAEARARRWRYDETLDASTLAEWISRQATDPNTLADVAAALHAGPQHLTASLARLRSQLAEACQQRDQAAAALVRAETERDEARLECATLEQDMDEIEQCLDETEQQNAGLRAERDEARQAHTNAKWLIDGQQQEIKYLRNRKDNPGCAKAHEDLATVEAERDSLREERDRLVAEVEKIADEYETEHKQACRRAEDMGLSDAARQRLLGSAQVWADVAGRLRAEAAMLRARVREWEAVNADLAARCDSGDIPIRLGERYSQAVLREIDRLRTERDRLRRRLGDVLDLEELPEDHTIVAAVRRLRAALGSTPDTGSTDG